MESYFAAPLPGASNVVSRLTDLVLQKGADIFAKTDLAKFVDSSTFHGLEWRGVGYMTPFLQSYATNGHEYVFGGGFPDSVMYSIPAQRLDVLNQTNLVLYGWELTGDRTAQWLYMGQFARFVSLRPQLPFESPSVLWLKAAGPKLGETVTRITYPEADQLSFVRRSTIGLTGIELQLLADWFESPDFPVGLNTFRAAAESHTTTTLEAPK